MTRDKMRKDVHIKADAAAEKRVIDALVGENASDETRQKFKKMLRDGALELNVMDYHSGRERGASSLSGGEAFLASLSLALGLSETIAEEAGGVTIDTLFVDEGFGSLDPAALDQAIGTLLRLGEGARLVGVVSHVEELRRRVPRQIVVDAAPDKGSRARVVCD